MQSAPHLLASSPFLVEYIIGNLVGGGHDDLPNLFLIKTGQSIFLPIFMMCRNKLFLIIHKTGRFRVDTAYYIYCSAQYCIPNKSQPTSSIAAQKSYVRCSSSAVIPFRSEVNLLWSIAPLCAEGITKFSNHYSAYQTIVVSVGLLLVFHILRFLDQSWQVNSLS